MQKLLRKWDEILEDYEHNVTHIYQRRIVHKIFDVVAHSILQFNFKGYLVERGWVDALIVGDTRTGKSQVAKKLSAHCHTPRPVPAENISIAGLVGGVQNIDKKWSINWGVWPLLNRRMATMDELTGLSIEQIGMLSDVRSSGMAKITKIQSSEAWAQVRKLWLSNVRQDKARNVSSYVFGVSTVPDLVGRPEDIARFDFATVLAIEEVPESVLNSPKVKKVKHCYTSEAARELVYWCWSRKAEDVVWGVGAEDAVLTVASAMCRKYSSDIPLVEQGEQRYRVARVAVALAARFHSTDKAGRQVKVLPAHVELAEAFFKECYDRPYCGYDRFSQRAMKASGDLEEANMTAILEALGVYQNAEMLLDAVAFGEDLARIQLMEFSKVPGFLQTLVKVGLLVQGQRGLEKTKKFAQFYNKLGGRQIERKSVY